MDMIVPTIKVLHIVSVSLMSIPYFISTQLSDHIQFENFKLVAKFWPGKWSHGFDE